jgi:hypothetical protein
VDAETQTLSNREKMTYVYLNQDVTPPVAHAFEARDLMDALQQASDLWFNAAPVLGFRQTGQSVTLLDDKPSLDERPNVIGNVRRVQ